MSARLRVLLIRPKEDGNVGAVARLARNFGASSLGFVAPRASLGPEARRRAMGGIALLKNAKTYPDLDSALAESDFVVGTTDLSTGRSASYLRRSISPERFGELCRGLDGRLALLFGPEDNGLSREELARCDLLVHIPARREFPTLNLSHAVAVVLYAVHRAGLVENPESTPAPEILLLNGHEKELFLQRASELIARTGYPAHKRRGLALLLRRVMGRSTPTEAEYRMLLGLLKNLERMTRGTKGSA
ncbi:MAG TPA: TrmJ/YjtD family RNA methyltransferase [Thermoplasmata archaeon]|nr:TrmJ/YjtD family RNA methyltransferase [Thermoplasmata archaeon]